MTAFAALRELARDDAIVETKVGGRRLRLVASPVFSGELPRVVWSDFLAVLHVGLVRRLRMTRILREKFSATATSITIAGKDEITIPISWAGAAMAAEPGCAGMCDELARAVDVAISRAGDKILAALPPSGRA